MASERHHTFATRMKKPLNTEAALGLLSMLPVFRKAVFPIFQHTPRFHLDPSSHPSKNASEPFSTPSSLSSPALDPSLNLLPESSLIQSFLSFAVLVEATIFMDWDYSNGLLI